MDGEIDGEIQERREQTRGRGVCSDSLFNKIEVLGKVNFSQLQEERRGFDKATEGRKLTALYRQERIATDSERSKKREEESIWIQLFKPLLERAC